MLGRAVIVAIVIAALCPFANVAKAGCTIEKLAETEIHVAENGHLLIPAIIKGEAVDFAIDTGAMMTLMDLSTVDRLELPRDVLMNRQLVSAFGRRTAMARTTIHELIIGGETVHEVRMLVVMGPPLSGSAAGVIGADFLSQFDLEFDVAGRGLRFFRRSRCRESGAVYWADRYSQTPIHIRSNRIIVPVTINGRAFNALLDSGASSTALSWRTAESLGLSHDSPGLTRIGFSKGFDGEPFPVLSYAFHEMSIAGETIRAPILKITDLEMQDADLTLGADFLAAHRVYIATEDERLYFTWNGTAGFAR